MTLFFSLSWLYHVFDNFKQKPWTPRSNFNHHTTRWVVPMFLSCFTRSRSRVGWFFFGPDRSIWIYRVIRWNHGNHHPKQLLLNFWRIQKKTPEKFARRSYSWFVRGVSLQQMGTHGVQMWQFFRVCMFFFFRYVSASTAPANIFFLYHAQVCFVLLDAEAKFPAFFTLEYVSGFGIPRWQTGLVWCPLWKSWTLRWSGISGRQPGSKMIFRTQETCYLVTGDSWKWSMSLGGGLWGNLPSFSRENFSS